MPVKERCRGEAMRLIYVDEAGTSQHELVRVVAAVIVEADRQWAAVVDDIARLISERVPEEYRPGFIFHAKEIFNGGRFREGWSKDDRLDFIKEFSCIPLVHDLPIAFGCVFSDAAPSIQNTMTWQQKLFLEHSIAFANCMERADYFLRTYLKGEEIGVVVAEDVPSKKRELAQMAMIQREEPIPLPAEHQSQSTADKAQGIFPDDTVLEIKKIVDVPHFAEKAQAPLLQLADACAFTFRRYLSRQSEGENLIHALLGPARSHDFLGNELWFLNQSSGLLNSEAYWEEDRQEEWKRYRTAFLRRWQNELLVGSGGGLGGS